MKIRKLLFYPLHIIRICKRNYIKNFKSKWYPLIKEPQTFFKTEKVIAPASWVKCRLPEVFEMQKSFTGELYMNRIVMYAIDNAIISYNSDLIITDKGCYWEKSFRKTFSVEIPLDNPLIEYNSDGVLLKKINDETFVPGIVISLVGVHSHIWAHFVVTFLPKLYYAGENGYLNENVTILTPSYKDSHLREMVSDYLSHFPQVKWKEITSDINYKCEHLLYIPALCALADHSGYILPAMGFFPSLVVDLLKKNLIEHFKKKADLIKGGENFFSKIYVIRRSNYRSIFNYQELEDLFSSMGFKLIDPGKMKLLEKVNVFSHADVIVGPLSGGFINTLFCKNGAKVLTFATLPRTVETFIPFIQTLNNFELLLVTGWDMDRTIQPDYFVSKERILSAYNDFIIR